MERELQLVLLRRLVDMWEKRTTSMADSFRRQPTTAYTDGLRFEEECRLLFGARPLVAGLSCDLPDPGDYFTCHLGGTPAIVIRSAGGPVTAFLNACRHRGSPVASGSGKAVRVFKCAYHAWTYGADGRLLGRPENDCFPEDKECLGLIPLPVTEASGLIFVSPDANGSPIDAERELAGLAPELAGLGLEGFVPFSRYEQVWTMNWKQPYDTFLEGYHVSSLHRETLSRKVLSSPMLTEEFGPHSRNLLMGRAGEQLPEVDEEQWSLFRTATLVYALFPNTIISIPRTQHIELWQCWPAEGSISRARITCQFYIPSDRATEEDREFWERVIEFSTRVLTGEDFTQQEGIWRSIKSGQLPELVFGRNEPGLIHFHRSLDAALS